MRNLACTAAAGILSLVLATTARADDTSPSGAAAPPVRAQAPATTTTPAPASATDATPSSSATDRIPDLTGMWRLDPARSDAMPAFGGGSGGAPGGGQAEGGQHGYGGSEGSGLGGGMEGGHGGGWGGGHGGHGGWGGHGGQHGGQGASENGQGGAGGPGGQGGGSRPAPLPDLMHVTETESLVSFEDSTGRVLQEITTIGTAKDTLMHAPGARVLAGTWSSGALTMARTSPRGTITQTMTLADSGNDLVILTRIQMEGSNVREFKRVYRKEQV